MLVEKIKAIAADNGWTFTYGPEAWQNLKDHPLDDKVEFADRKKHLKLLWKDRSHKVDKYGTTYGYTFTGEMLLLVRSKISDSSYNYKYETHIKNLEVLSEVLKDSFSICEPFVVRNWVEIEVTDLFDNNLDGFKIKFTIDYD